MILDIQLTIFHVPMINIDSIQVRLCSIHSRGRHGVVIKSMKELSQKEKLALPRKIYQDNCILYNSTQWPLE